jgi:hypothetical protein
MNESFKFHISRSNEWLGYTVYIKTNDGIVTDIKMTVDNSIQKGTYIPPPLVLDEKSAQNLLQELWNAGLRPNNGEGTSAQVDALKYHLEDMRKLVFK